MAMGLNPAVSGVIREGRATKSDDLSEKCQRGHSASEFKVKEDIFVFHHIQAFGKHKNLQ